VWLMVECLPVECLHVLELLMRFLQMTSGTGQGSLSGDSLCHTYMGDIPSHAMNRLVELHCEDVPCRQGT